MAQAKAERLHSKIAALKVKMQELQAIEIQLQTAPDKQISLTDPRLDQAPEMMRIRRQTVEHPFGTLKAWMGATHFLTRTLDRVSTEMSLHVLAYNFKRVLNLLGNGALMAAMRV